MKNIRIIVLVMLISGPFFCFGQSFTTTVIGSQTWRCQNLNVDTFRNGDRIPEEKTNGEWIKACNNKQPAWCYYDNELFNSAKHGKMYNWYAVNDPRGLAPKGWHIPDYTEWQQLISTLGDESVAGAKMKSKSGWNDNGNGNNKSNFCAFPGGYRMDDGSFVEIGNNVGWWCANEDNASDAGAFSVGGFNSGVYTLSSPKCCGYYVRCLKD